MFFRQRDRRSHEKIVRENGGCRGGNVARKNGEIERAGFFQAAGGRSEAESVRQRGFGGSVLHSRRVQGASAALPEGTSSPRSERRAQRVGEFLKDLRFAGSWFGSCFCGFFVETSFQIGDRRAHAFGRSAAGNFFRGKGRFDAETFRKIGIKRGRNLFELFQWQGSERNALLFRFAQDFADDVVRLAERNALANKIIRCFGRQQRGIGSGGAQTLGVELRGSQRAGRDREHVRDLIVRGKERFFVFLQVALIAGGQAFERC